MRRQHRLLSQKSTSAVNKSNNHIVEENLNRKSLLIDKYQTQIQGLIQQMDRDPVNRKKDQPNTERRSLNRSRLNSNRQQTIPYDGSPSVGGFNDYQKLILGLEYSLESERKKVELLQNKNASLQTQISNLRNLLVGPDQQKYYQKTIMKEYQEKINNLQTKLLDQKKNYDFIIDSKNQSLASLQFELRTLQKKLNDDIKDNTSKKILQLMAIVDQLRSSILKKNIKIQKLTFHKDEPVDSDSDDQQLKGKAKAKKIEFYADQLEISNKLILRKNIQILNISKKTLKYQEILDVIQQYLDKKEVKNVDLNVLQHACVNKLRLLLREKAVFQRQLLNQLNEHNKKISNFEQQVMQRDKTNGGKIVQVINDNKRLTALVTTLQTTIKNLQKSLEDQRREEQILKNQIEINKKHFVQDVRKLKEELNTISSVTKNQFDRLKIENLKLSEQNRSLLFLVGQKQKQIYKKGDAIRSFEQYKDKINNLSIGGPEKRKIQNINEQQPQIGAKMLLINTFSNWMMQWNKIRNWNNKKVLLNLILDKEQIREDALNSLTFLINVLHQSLLSSKNIEVQERATILLSYYLKHSILKNVNLYVDKISPIILRGFRQKIEGEDEERLRLLNQASLKITSSMERNQFKWNQEMTNQMISVNGLKYLMNILEKSQVDQLVESAYNCLIMIAKQNQMISFMNSYNISTFLLNNMSNQYPFIIYALHLLKTLLSSKDFIKSQKSLLQFRKIYGIMKKQQDEETVDLTLDCSLLLMQNSLFVKSLNKIETISILSQAVRNMSQYHILKKIGQVYTIILSQMQVENVPRMIKQIQKMLDIIGGKKYNENRFNRAVRIVLKVAEMLTDNNQLDQKIMTGLTQLYEHYDMIQSKTRIKINSIISTIYQRNKEIINKFSNEDWIIALVEAYKSTNVNEELIFLLKILQFQHQQKRTTQILRAGRQTLIGKHITDALIPDYNVALPALKNLLAISKEKYAQKFVNKNLFGKIVSKILTSRNQQEYIGTVISILYFFSKNQEVSLIILECGLVERVFHIIVERHDKQNLIYKCLTLLQLAHTTNYKKKILNYLISNDSNLQILKTLNFILKKAKNKQQTGTRAVFIYDFLLGKTAVQSLALLVEQNVWMVSDLIEVRNEYVTKVDPLVYKIQLLLHNMSAVNTKVRKVYQKFKIEGEYQSEDDR